MFLLHINIRTRCERDGDARAVRASQHAGENATMKQTHGFSDRSDALTVAAVHMHVFKLSNLNARHQMYSSIER